jgi:hypothetical protein
MVGCAGSVAFGDRGTLCSSSYRIATAYEWTRHFGGVAPTHNYWTDDNLHYNGSSSSCFVDFNGTACPSGQPMRVCTSSGTDPEGNHCNWSNCGLMATTPNQYFGGCYGNTTAGALCVPRVGCAAGPSSQIFAIGTGAQGVHGCAGSVTWDVRNSLCSAGWFPVKAAVWASDHGSVPPTHSYWTDDNLEYSGTGSNSCAVSLTGGVSCPTNQPMRVCPSSSPDPEGNPCNWTNCGLNASTPNQYFGGCSGNSTAGTLCGNGDLEAIVDGFQNITSETFTSSSGDVADGCITAGTHRVMRFTFHSRNVGRAAVTLGSPPSNPNTYSPIFVWSAAHVHWHIRNFNTLSLTNTSTGAVTTGLKQGYCLMDNHQWASNPPPSVYTCSYQGVSQGWDDVYNFDLPCQFINMDSVGDGTYQFSAAMNVSHVVEESDYGNNVATATLQIQGNRVTVLH